MASLNQCDRCRRRYVVIGQRNGKLLIWICPRCKKARNLPRVLLDLAIPPR